MSTVLTSTVLSSSGAGTEETFTTMDSDSAVNGVLSVLIDGTNATTDAIFRIYQWAPDASYKALAWEATIGPSQTGGLSPPLLVGGTVIGLTFGLVTTDAVDWPVTVLKEANVLNSWVSDLSPQTVNTPSTTEIASTSFGSSALYQALVFAQLPLASGETLTVRDRIADNWFTNVTANQSTVDDTAAAGAYPGIVIYGVPIPAAGDASSHLVRAGGSGTRDIYRQFFQIQAP